MSKSLCTLYREKCEFDEPSLKIAKLIEAAEFASMPLTTPARQATVAELIHTMENDANTLREALQGLREWLEKT